MTENDTLHLWFKPHNGVVQDADLTFVDQYGKRFYPKAMLPLMAHLHRSIARITKSYQPSTFVYQLTHHTKANSKRYVIEENLRDSADFSGLNMGIQFSTQEERDLIHACFNDAENQATKTTSVANLIAYMTDSMTFESEKWAGLKLAGGADATPLLEELLHFLKQVKNISRVLTFTLEQTESSMKLSIVLITPGVLAYYTRIDWNIV